MAGKFWIKLGEREIEKGCDNLVVRSGFFNGDGVCLSWPSIVHNLGKWHGFWAFGMSRV